VIFVQRYEFCLNIYSLVLRYLDITSLSKKQHEYLQKHLRILSGLYGALRPFDEMKPYRLEMGTKLVSERGKTLYDFWGSSIAEVLQADLGKEKTIINVASNEYFKAVDQKSLDGVTIINCHFKQRKDGSLKIVSVFAKQARGLFVRWCAQNDVTSVNDLKKFDLEGYKFMSSESDETNLVFGRKQPEKGKKRKNTSSGRKGKKRKG